VTMISRGVEISIAGGGGEMVRALTLYPPNSLFLPLPYPDPSRGPSMQIPAENSNGLAYFSCILEPALIEGIGVSLPLYRISPTSRAVMDMITILIFSNVAH